MFCDMLNSQSDIKLQVDRGFFSANSDLYNNFNFIVQSLENNGER